MGISLVEEGDIQGLSECQGPGLLRSPDNAELDDNGQGPLQVEGFLIGSRGRR